MSYIAQIESYVAGIPCIIGVVDYTCVKGSYNYHAASDWDYHGYTESEWEVCDRKGRPAPWLARKLTSEIEREIEREIAEYFN